MKSNLGAASKTVNFGGMLASYVALILALLMAAWSFGPLLLAKIAPAQQPAPPPVVEMVQLKDGTTFAGQVVSTSGALRLSHAQALSVQQPAKDAPAEEKPKLQVTDLAKTELKASGEMTISIDMVALIQPLTPDSPIYKAVVGQ